jgi:hypothetical protein
MGVWTSPSKPARRDLPIRLSENQLQQVYVPFVDQTEAAKVDQTDARSRTTKLTSGGRAERQ